MGLLLLRAFCLMAIASIFVGDPATCAPVDPCAHEAPDRAADLYDDEMEISFFWSPCPKMPSFCDHPTYYVCLLQADQKVSNEFRTAAKGQKSENLSLEFVDLEHYSLTLVGQDEFKEGFPEKIIFSCQYAVTWAWRLEMKVKVVDALPPGSASRAFPAQDGNVHSPTGNKGGLSNDWISKVKDDFDPLKEIKELNIGNEIKRALQNLTTQLKHLEDVDKEQTVLVSLYQHESKIYAGLDRLKSTRAYPNDTVLEENLKNFVPTVLDSIKGLLAAMTEIRNIQPNFLEILRDTYECHKETIQARINTMLRPILVGIEVYVASVEFFPEENRESMWNQYEMIRTMVINVACSHVQHNEQVCNDRGTKETSDSSTDVSQIAIYVILAIEVLKLMTEWLPPIVRACMRGRPSNADHQTDMETQTEAHPTE